MITLVVNRMAGTARKLGPEELERRLTEAVERHVGESPRLVALEPEGFDDTLDRLAAELSPGDDVWVAGGDGTVTSIGRHLVGRDGVLGIVPLGTMNLLARDLGIPMDIEEAVEALAKAPTARIDVGRMNGEVFLVKSALGLYPEIVVDRQRRLKLGSWGKWPAMFRSMWRTLKRSRQMTVEIVLDGKHRTVRTTAIVIANNPLEFRAGRIFTRPAIDTGQLAVYISHKKTSLGSFRTTLEVFLGSLTDDPEMEVIRTRAVELRFSRPRPVANDGEVASVAPPLRYTIDPGALAVRYPGRAQQPQGTLA